MDLYTQYAMEIAMIHILTVIDYQRRRIDYGLEGHPFEAQQAAIALASLGRILLDARQAAEEFTAFRKTQQQAKVLEFSEHENARQA